MADRSDGDARLASGQAWIDFCEELKGAGADLLRDAAPKSDVDLAEGHRYLTRMLRSAFELIMEGGNPASPVLFRSLHETLKIGWDNPDNVHWNANLSGAYDYRIYGTRGDAHYMSFGVYAGSFGRGGRRTVAYVSADDLDVADDGSFEVVLSGREHEGNWIHIDPDASTLMIRQTFWDKPNEREAKLDIERIHAENPPLPLDPGFVASAFRRTTRYLRGTNKLFFDMSDMWKEKPNTFFPSDPVVAAQTQGIPGMYYASGWWQCAPDAALVLDVVPPKCRYWGFVLSNYWGESFEYRHRTVHNNKKTASYRPDGSVRWVIAHEDPELPNANWLDTGGHDAGIWTIRWLEAETHPHPDIRVMKLDEARALTG